MDGAARVEGIERPVATSRFRRRLTLAFVLVAGLSSGALAIACSLGVQEYRHREFRDAAREETNTYVRFLEGRGGASTGPVVELLQRPGGPDVVVLQDGIVEQSATRFGLDVVPERLREQVATGTGGQVDTELGDAPFVVTGARTSTGADLYAFFDRSEVDQSVRRFSQALGIGWVLIVVIAGLVGDLVARRTLRPVRAAGDAALALAEGLLDTRLPVSTSDEFGAWAGHFNSMAEGLEQRIAALAAAQERERRFSASVAHELRTPLTSLVGAASLVEDRAGALPPELRRPVELLVTEVRRLRRLTDDLLELFRMEAGQEELRAEPTELGEAVATALHSCGWSQHVDLRTDEPVHAVLDRRRLDRIVVNLVDNARRHGGGHVTVTVRRDGATAVLSVADEGPGIPPEELPRLFDRFYRLSTSPSGEGSGLGLAIAAESARAMGGDIVVASTVGEGTTFTLRLPGSAPPEGRAPAASAPAARSAATTG